MGKNIYMKNMDDELDDINPSCMWGIIHAVNFHHLHRNVKRILPHRRNHGFSNGHGSPKTRALENPSGEVEMLLHEEEEISSPVNQSSKESASISKRSLKTRIKALIAHPIQKERNDKHRGSRFSSQYGLKRTNSIHHLEPPDHGFSEICTDWEHPIIFFPSNEEDKCTTKHQDPTKMNADDGIRKLAHVLSASKANSRLMKSGSFPVGDFSWRRRFGTSKLKDKQNEIWSTPRGEKFPVGNLVTRDVLNYSKNLLSRSGSSANNSTATMLGRALSLILESTVESDKEGFRDFAAPSNESKQAVQFQDFKGKNEANSSLSALDKVSDTQDFSTMEKDFSEISAEITINRDGSDRNEKDIDYRNSTFARSRSSSLNESQDKYASLFDSNLRKEVKLQFSKSLRLSNENEMKSGKSAPILFTRIRSLSHLDEFYSSLQNEVQGDANFADWPIGLGEETSSRTTDDTRGELKRAGCSTSTEEYAVPNDSHELGHQNEMLETKGVQTIDNSPELGENIKVGKSNSDQDQETNNSEIIYNKFPEPSPSSASKNFSQDEASVFMEFQSTEGLESRSDHFETIAIPDHINDNDIDLDYVRDILERSGFTKEAFQWTWHSLDVPLNPSIFEEMEADWHQEVECSKEELLSCNHHQLLFELVNEELGRLYDKSATYYPKALSSSCHIRPFPEGNRLIEEVCSSIISLLNLKPEEMQSLDLDLKNDGWMNLQLESECMALELEDMIFDELLEELESL